MTLTLYCHPLSSYCWKALIALDEKAVDFASSFVDFADAKARESFLALSPFGKMPVLVDAARGETVAESTIIIEYLEIFRGGARRLIPADPDSAWTARLWDRFFDLYLHSPMQAAVRTAFNTDETSARAARAAAEADIRGGYVILERALGRGPWMTGDDFSIADCAAVPALFYADIGAPLGTEYPACAAYLDRLVRRPSVRRVLAAAEPYFHMYPLEPKPVLRT